ncbi:hypothetical protein C8F01DRAFT_1089388 [Mycena amicta]|nr:hypothetical protein C8F01DRAFT_1089388 [Mycena amicta]
MASVSAPLILSCRPLPAHLGLADGELAAQQRTSENICVRSRHFQNMVQLSYPAQLEPALLLVHLRHLDVYWPCLCPDFPSSRFRLFGDGSAVVMCHHTKPKCQYFMNLNKIAQTATIRDYPYDLGEDSLQTLRMLDLLTVRADVQNPLKICRGIRAAPTFAGDSGKFQLGGYMPLESCVSDTLVGFMQIPADLLLASAVLPTHEIPTFRSFGQSPYFFASNELIKA